MESLPCPLCLSVNSNDYFTDKKRSYKQCKNCSLVFVPKHYYLTTSQEKAVYDQHQNDLEDADYRLFLSRLFEPLQQHLSSCMKGLDFGCGPGPLLAHMFTEQGHQMNVFDVYYANTPESLQQPYDFITCTEVIEHLGKPGEVLEQLWQLIKPGGWLAIMTKMVINNDAFSDWHYKNDPTHICFYSQDTFRWLQDQLQCDLEFIGADVILMRKPGQSQFQTDK